MTTGSTGPSGTRRLRRAGDRYVSVGCVAIAWFMWITEVRLAQQSDWLAVVLYLLPTVLMSVAAAVMVRDLVRRRMR
jgi:uncharacterized protein (DUF983 family)